MKRALVYGLAITGEAVAAGLLAHGYDIVVADDQPTPVRVAAADRLGTELIGAPEVDEIARLMESCDLVCPAPGVPENHDVIRAAVAGGVPVVTELDLAYEWEADRPGGPRPMLAVTGTDGKTTTTMLVAAMVRAAGPQGGRGRQHRGPAGRRVGHRRRGVRRGVQQLPAQLAAQLPRRVVGVVEPRARPPELAQLDGRVRVEQVAAVVPPALHGHARSATSTTRS